jgi:uncharacterized membrane protein
MWSDEYRGTYLLIRLPVKDLLTGNYTWEFNPPLYFFLLKAWVKVFGDGETTMRVLSVVFYSASLLVMYLVGKNIGGWRAGAAGMSILVFHPEFIYQSTTLRPYPFLILLTLIALLASQSYSSCSSRRPYLWLAVLCASLVLANYTHYFGGLIGLGIGLFSIIRLGIARDRAQTGVLVVVALSFLASSPLILLISRQIASVVAATGGSDLQFPRLGLPAVLAIFSGTGLLDYQIGNILHVLSLLSVLSGAFVLWRNGRPTEAAALSLLLLLGSLAAVGLSWNNFHIAPRYLLHVTLAAWILAAGALLASQDTLSGALRIVILITLAGYGLVGAARIVTRAYPHPDWKAVAKVMARERQEGEPVVILGWDATPASYYLGMDYLTSFDFEKQIKEGTHHQFLLLDSRNGRKLDLEAASTQTLYEDPRWSVKIMRWSPVPP